MKNSGIGCIYFRDFKLSFDYKNINIVGENYLIYKGEYKKCLNLV